MGRGAVVRRAHAGQQRNPATIANLTGLSGTATPILLRPRKILSSNAGDFAYSQIHRSYRQSDGAMVRPVRPSSAAQPSAGIPLQAAVAGQALGPGGYPAHHRCALCCNGALPHGDGRPAALAPRPAGTVGSDRRAGCPPGKSGHPAGGALDRQGHLCYNQLTFPSNGRVTCNGARARAARRTAGRDGRAA